MTSHKHSLAAKYSSKWRPRFGPNFVRIAGTSETETSVSEKAECLLDTDEDKK